ncbi:MAG: hypothetical protein MJY95_02825 [Bacteroidaceae bacterium]|nr:hypothetical protein [Bacteroidaceae bacterium]
MKRLFLTCLLSALAFGGIFAQEETADTTQQEAKKGWIYLEEESNTPGKFNKFAISNANEILDARNGKVTVSLIIMKTEDKGYVMSFRTASQLFSVDQNMMQRVLIKFDEGRASNYSLTGTNNDRESPILNCAGTYKQKFKKELVNAKTVTATFRFVDDPDAYTFTFDVADVNQDLLK